MKRRSFLASLSLATAGGLIPRQGIAQADFARTAAPDSNPPEKLPLHFQEDVSFKILAISDLHYTPEPDPNGIELTRKLIALERPNLVIATGDNISGDSCSTENDVKQAVANVASAFESGEVPWAITLGNHDQEHFARTHISRQQIFDYYEAYPHNVNGGWNRHLHGAGNKYLLIRDPAGAGLPFALWLIDSGGKSDDPSIRYDWIHTDQVAWYYQASRDLEKSHGAGLPGLMFFHIPLLEFQEMILTRKVLGERHEPESPSRINSGLFAAVVDRGDVKGIFCGHDHVNNYAGKFHGITLGYNGVVGFHGYPHTPPGDPTNDRARGARVFALNASTPERFRTWMRFRDGSTSWEHWSDAYELDEIK